MVACPSFVLREDIITPSKAFSSAVFSLFSFHCHPHRKLSSPCTCWAPTPSFQTSPSSSPNSSPAPRAPARQVAAARARGRLPRGGSTIHVCSVCLTKLELRHGSKIFKCHVFSPSGSIVQFSLLIDVLSTSWFLICYWKLRKNKIFFHTALIKIS